MAQNTWQTLHKSQLQEEDGSPSWQNMVMWCHKTNMARYHWKQGMAIKQYHELVSEAYKVNVEHGNKTSSWDDMVPAPDHQNPQRVNGYINIPREYLEEMGLLHEAIDTYFTDWDHRDYLYV